MDRVRNEGVELVSLLVRGKLRLPKKERVVADLETVHLQLLNLELFGLDRVR